MPSYLVLVFKCFVIGVFISAPLEPVHAKNTVTYKPLEHYWSSSRNDNATSATLASKNAALAAKYRFVRNDGYVLNTPSNAEGQAAPLYLYYSKARKDHYTTATSAGIRSAESSGYKRVRTQGYILKTVHPEFRHLYRPLWLYYNDKRKDHFTTSTRAGIRDAEAGGYKKVRREGYLLRSPDRNHLISLPPGPSVLTAKYLGNYPGNGENLWSDSLQGVGHDRDNWFFTQTTRLWKFPITHDLNKGINSLDRLPTGVRSVGIPNSLSRLGYSHFGDLEEFNGYLLIPLEAEASYAQKLKDKVVPSVALQHVNKPLLAVFRASDLAYVGSARLSKQTRAGWVAINPADGLLYTSHNELDSSNKLLTYRFELDALRKDNIEGELSYIGTKELLDKNGKIITVKPYMQGGAFSDDGKYLFLLNGKLLNNSSDGGIWVFDFNSGRKLLKSTTGKNAAFRYLFKPGKRHMQEPEGLTYWNLDRRNAPGIRGKLHAILLNRNYSSIGNYFAGDKFWLKHYLIDYPGNYLESDTQAANETYESCEKNSIATCSKHGAECTVVDTRSGSAVDLCRWPSKKTAADCKGAQGIWTTPGSKYAKNHPGAVDTGATGACITEVNNIKNMGRRDRELMNERRSWGQTQYQ